MTAGQTIQIDLNGQKIDVEKEIILRRTLRYFAPWFTVSLSESAQEKIEALKKKADTQAINDYLATHMKPRFPKLPKGKEGEVFQEALNLFEQVIWLH